MTCDFATGVGLAACTPKQLGGEDRTALSLQFGSESKVGMAQHLADGIDESQRLDLTHPGQALVEPEPRQSFEHPGRSIECGAVLAHHGLLTIDQGNVESRPLVQLCEAFTNDVLVGEGLRRMVQESFDGIADRLRFAEALEHCSGFSRGGASGCRGVMTGGIAAMEPAATPANVIGAPAGRLFAPCIGLTALGVAFARLSMTNVGRGRFHDRFGPLDVRSLAFLACSGGGRHIRLRSSASVMRIGLADVTGITTLAPLSLGVVDR